jgi:hypothetical protein
MELTFSAIVVIVLMGGWLLASVAIQCAHLYANSVPQTKPPGWWRRGDFMGLLPRWTFFSMVPESDARILYRDRLFDGVLTPWRLMEMPPRNGFRFLWNPGRRKRKAADDLCLGFTVAFARRLDASLQSSPESFWYVALTHFVSQAPAPPLNESRQFMIAKTFAGNGRPAEILFVSPFFHLSGATGSEVAHVVVDKHADESDVSACASPCHS